MPALAMGDTASPAQWAAYLVLLALVAGWVFLYNKPMVSYFGRYRYQGRHWPPASQSAVPAVLADVITTQVIPHEHHVYTVSQDGAQCRCGAWRHIRSTIWHNP